MSHGWEEDSMLVKRLAAYIPIYLQPFLRYSKLLVESWDIFTPHLCLAALQGVTPSEFREDLDTHKAIMNGLSYGEESITICSAVLIQYRCVTDGQTDGRTSSIAITCVSRLTHVKITYWQVTCDCIILHCSMFVHCVHLHFLCESLPLASISLFVI